MNKKELGLLNNFEVKRTDGKNVPGEKHEGCQYFVLDLDHDPFAIPALRAYADACREEYPELAKDLTAILDKKGIETPESSNIQFIARNRENKTVLVQFKNGGLYKYFDVPDGVWQSFKLADSKGRFLHKVIKEYRCEKQESEE